RPAPRRPAHRTSPSPRRDARRARTSWRERQAAVDGARRRALSVVPPDRTGEVRAGAGTRARRVDCVRPRRGLLRRSGRRARTAHLLHDGSGQSCRRCGEADHARSERRPARPGVTVAARRRVNVTLRSRSRRFNAEIAEIAELLRWQSYSVVSAFRRTWISLSRSTTSTSSDVIDQYGTP